MDQDLLLAAAARVQCAVEGHDWGPVEEEGHPYVSYFVSVCQRCTDHLREPAPSYTMRETPIKDGGWE